VTTLKERTASGATSATLAEAAGTPALDALLAGSST
jgi:hypothetical protein